MQLEQSLGLVAGALVTFSMIPQLIRVFQLRSAREISKLFTILLLAGMICWLAYGICLRLTPVILWNAIGAVLVGLLLYGKSKYGK
ncbi:MAG: SemiSWEET family sugar transporter [Dehalococcoidia bacterium]